QIGRAARNSNSLVILYADAVTPAMQGAIDETNRRREKQLAYNLENGITPQTIKKSIKQAMEMEIRARKTVAEAIRADEAELDITEAIEGVEARMLQAAQNLEFEKSAAYRDRLKELKSMPLTGKVALKPAEPEKPKPGTPGTRPTKKKRKFKRGDGSAVEG